MTHPSLSRFEGDISGIDFDSSNNTKDFAFNAFIDDDKLWPNAIIPYTINEDEFSKKKARSLLANIMYLI
ncbi:hypothetical protein BV898_11483 [Hypsibius exemplaris]|uniref:Uncharacterized protein n=1 Tax=Hypsibius exemplaris TaxID=2072580 RepID=A0A1W0WGN8_HYPEX|nr:hypothetical protein BV898_11483 [Hypsibius exemplaris]